MSADLPIAPRRTAPALARRALALTASAWGLAVAAPAFEEDAFFEPLPVVLTASRLPQTLADAPGAMTVIDRPLIEATGYRDLPRLLRFVPGMHVGYERGHNSRVSYHGLGLSFPGEMPVLIDGVSTQVPTNFGAASWADLPVFISEIERIEVVRGASANSFGTSALLGAVNLITRTGAEVPGTHAAARLGDDSIRDLEVGTAGGDQALSWRITAGSRADEGFRGLHDEREVQRISLRTDHQLNAVDSVTIRLGGVNGRTGRGYPDSPLDSNGLRDADSTSGLLQLRWRHVRDVDREYTLSLYHHEFDYRADWLVNGAGFSDVPVDRDRRTLRTSLEWQARERWATALRGVWGLETARTRTRSRAFFATGNALEERTHRLFGNLEWRADPALVVNLGLTTQRASAAGWRLGSRLYANIHATTRDTLRMGVSRTWRDANQFEREGDYQVHDPASGLLLARLYLPNDELRPTRADAFELGYLRRLDIGMLDLRLFSERLRDPMLREVVAAPPPAPVLEALVPSTRYVNSAHDLVLHGAELQLLVRPWRDGELRLAWSVIERNAQDRDVEAGIAPYTAQLSWRQEWPHRWSSHLGVSRVGPVASGDSFLAGTNYVVEDATTIDFALTRRFDVGGRPARLQLAALNLGPRHQEVADPVMQLVYGNRAANRVSRQVYAGLELRF